MGKKLPRKACPFCGLTRVAYYPASGVVVRHVRADGEGPEEPWGYWCPYPQMQRDGAADIFDNASYAVSAGPAMILGDSGPVRNELADWWRGVTEDDIAAMLPKAREYSAYDLILLGKATADMVGAFDPEPYEEGVPDGVYAEIGCWWYLMGKVARAIGAIKEGRLPSEDTAADARIYATMISRIKAVGGWPGIEL